MINSYIVICYDPWHCYTNVWIDEASKRVEIFADIKMTKRYIERISIQYPKYIFSIHKIKVIAIEG